MSRSRTRTLVRVAAVPLMVTALALVAPRAASDDQAPRVKFIRRLGRLSSGRLGVPERGVCDWLGLDTSRSGASHQPLKARHERTVNHQE